MLTDFDGVQERLPLLSRERDRLDDQVIEDSMLNVLGVFVWSAEMDGVLEWL